MGVWQALIIGLLVGWLAEWVIDWVYWRGRRASSTAELATAIGERDKLRADVATAKRDMAELPQLRGALADCRAGGERLQAELTAAQGLAPQLRAELTSAQGNLASARALADERQATIDRLEGELRDARAAGAKTMVLPAATLAAPAVLGTLGEGATDSGLHGENERLRGELESLRSAFAAVRRDQRDALVDINGIGPVYEKKLFAAGILTFEELAAMTPEQVTTIIKPERWQEIDAAGWIAEAAALARRSRPSALRSIDGIGVVYEKRLFDAGVYTFEQLAAMSAEQVRAVIKPEDWQAIEPEAWIEEARVRAANLQARSAAV